MSDTLKRFFVIACACVAAYLLLHVLRSLHVESEVRGLWAGAFGFMVSELVAPKVSRRRKQ